MNDYCNCSMDCIEITWFWNRLSNKKWKPLMIYKLYIKGCSEMQINLIMCTRSCNKVLDCKPFVGSLHSNSKDVYCRLIHDSLLLRLGLKSSNYVY